MPDHDITGTAEAEHHGAGPLARHLASFAEHLIAQGYARKTRRAQLSLVRALNRWMVHRRIPLAGLDEHVGKAFLRAGHARRRRGAASTVGQLLTHLRVRGVILDPSPVVDESPRAQLERRYHDYLRVERGLATTTVQTYVWIARQFLTEQRDEAWSSSAPSA